MARRIDSALSRALGVASIQLGFWGLVGYLAVDLHEGSPGGLFRREPDLPEALVWLAERRLPNDENVVAHLRMIQPRGRTDPGE